MLSCALIANAASSCPTDLDQDGSTMDTDLVSLLGSWDTPEGDIDGDGNTGFPDLTAACRPAFGPCASLKNSICPVSEIPARWMWRLWKTGTLTPSMEPRDKSDRHPRRRLVARGRNPGAGAIVPLNASAVSPSPEPDWMTLKATIPFRRTNKLR